MRTSNEIFNILTGDFAENEIDWNKCVGICTDGARAMIGSLSGVVTRIKEVAPLCISTHCIIHRESLAAKNMPDPLIKVLNEAVKTINFIESRALNSRLFSILCSEMGSDHTTLLLHTEVRWLSRGKVLSRLFELRNEVKIFLKTSQERNDINFTNEIWLSRLAYLSDIFARLNELNLSLQGANNSVFDLNDKILAFKRKLRLILQQIEKGDISMLFSLSAFVDENKISVSEQVLADINQHIISMLQSFEKYFPENVISQNWIRNPFAFQFDIPDNVNDKESFIDLISDGNLKIKFNNSNLCSFWLSIRKEYPELSSQAIKFLMTFSTTYLCETGFSTMSAIKNKYRSLLSIESDLRLKLSKISPDMLVRNKQAQPSH